MYLVYTRYIPDIYFGVYVGIYQVYTRYIPGLEITRYIPGIYLVYTSYIADIGLYPVYTRYIPGKFHFYRFQMTSCHRDRHGVSIPELKKSTNLKMHLKPSVQDVWQNLDSGSTL